MTPRGERVIWLASSGGFGGLHTALVKAYTVEEARHRGARALDVHKSAVTVRIKR
jgi:hypothetical protein